MATTARSRTVTGLIIACAVLQALLYRDFVAGSGRIGQQILLDLRRRVFAHFQRLSLAFHESYTTGRMISRLTSDFDAINDMFTLGLDTVITAVLSVVSVGIILLVLDWRLGLVCLTGFVPLYFLSRWYQRESSAAYRNTRSAMALVIVQFTESLRGIRAVHAFRRQERNDEIFQELSEGYRITMTRSFQLLGIYWPGIVLIGNLTTAAVLLYGGRQGDRWEHAGGRAGVVRAVFATFLRAACRGEPVLRLVSGRGRRPREARRRSRRGAARPSPSTAPRLRTRASAGAWSSAMSASGTGRDRGALGLRAPDPRRPDRRSAGSHRSGKEHRRQAARPLLRPARRSGPHRLGRPARSLGGGPPRRGRHGDPGELPLLGHRRREHRASVAPTRPTPK